MPAAVAPGAMALARIPRPRYITARDFTRPTIPCLAAVQAAPAALPRSPAAPAVKTIAPRPAASMCGSAARVSRKDAVRLIRTTRSHSVSSVSARADIRSRIPALFTSTSSTSSTPNTSTAVATTSSTTVCSLRSPTTRTARPPSCSISLTVPSAPARSRSATRTSAPASANCSAAARPIPDPAPVTTRPRPSRPLPRMAYSLVLSRSAAVVPRWGRRFVRGPGADPGEWPATGSGTAPTPVPTGSARGPPSAQGGPGSGERGLSCAPDSCRPVLGAGFLELGKHI